MTGTGLVELFVQCPACQQMGHHNFQLRDFRKQTIPGVDGEPIDVSGFGDPPDGTPVIDRWCVFCGHAWTCSRE